MLRHRHIGRRRIVVLERDLPDRLVTLVHNQVAHGHLLHHLVVQDLDEPDLVRVDECPLHPEKDVDRHAKDVGELNYIDDEADYEYSDEQIQHHLDHLD